jgi:hypothetical protein
VRVLETYGAVRPQRADDEWFWSESDILGGCAGTETDLDVGGSATPSAIVFLSPDRPCFLYVGLPESDSGVTLAYDPRLGFATLIEALIGVDGSFEDESDLRETGDAQALPRISLGRARIAGGSRHLVFFRIDEVMYAASRKSWKKWHKPPAGEQKRSR